MAKQDVVFSHYTQRCVRNLYTKVRGEGNEKVEEMRNRKKWDNVDFICCGHILNDMVDSLFNLY